MLISIDELDYAEEQYKVIKNTDIQDRFAAMASRSLLDNETVKNDNIVTKERNQESRKALLNTLSTEPFDFAYERSIGKNDSVYSNFVELIQHAKSKVGRIVIKSGIRKKGFATGFMVSEKLLLTNWHVFPSIDAVEDSEVQFHYEYNAFGEAKIPITFKLESKVFYHSNKALDYCFIAVNPLSIDGLYHIKDIGYLFLDPVKGKIGNEGEEKLNIIHHPDGDLKQLSIRENKFIKITPISIWYQTDTAPGSSGSPVFNDQWQVVALHHMGVGKKNAEGDYIDKAGNALPKIDGKIDAKDIVWEANEGIRISVILNDVFQEFQHHELILALTQPPKNLPTFGNPSLPTNDSSLNPFDHKNNNPLMQVPPQNNNVFITFPSSLIEKNGMVNISIDQGKPSNNIGSSPSLPNGQNDQEIEAAEIMRLEEATDYTLCKGYQANFLGTKLIVALPQPQASIKHMMAKLNDSKSIELKYFNYSVIQHAIRKMPLLSAINIDGNPLKRQDNTARKDNWLRDTRLSFDMQLNNAFYKNSGFDKGHMSRREDANWGNSADDAKRNADLTCMFTNACPQVAKLNQSSRKGLWGLLEKIVLEKGAVQEENKTAKITVFNGPIYKEDDRVFRGVQIPLDFFKIVLWLTDKGTLRATAFKLTQEGLTDDIDFEQLNIDQNLDFKQYQCSIGSLQSLTKIDFSKLLPFDTFKSSNGKDRPINNADDIESILLE